MGNVVNVGEPDENGMVTLDLDFSDEEMVLLEKNAEEHNISVEEYILHLLEAAVKEKEGEKDNNEL